jgi:hypothetical protein
MILEEILTQNKNKNMDMGAAINDWLTKRNPLRSTTFTNTNIKGRHHQR